MLDDLVERSAEHGVEGPHSWFGRPLGSADLLLAPIRGQLRPHAKRLARGISIIVSTSSSVQIMARALFAGEGSPSRVKVETELRNGTMDLPAMVVQRCLRSRNGGEKI
jgi:hypothetical protein